MHRVAGGIQFAPAINGLQKALDAQICPARRIGKQCPGGILQLGQHGVQLHEIQRRERLVLVKMQRRSWLDDMAAAVQPLHIGVGQGVPGLAQHIGVRSKAAGAVAGFQRTVQMRQCCPSQPGRGGPAGGGSSHHARAGGFAGQQILALGLSCVSSSASTMAITLPSVYQRSSGSSPARHRTRPSKMPLGSTSARSKPCIASEISLVRIRRWWVSQSQPPLMVSMSQLSPSRSSAAALRRRSPRRSHFPKCQTRAARGR